MYIDKGGKEWSSEDAYNKAIFNIRRVFRYDLAFEDYEDDNGVTLKELDPIYEGLKEYRAKLKENLLNEVELIKITDKIINQFDKVVDIIGKEKFIFYDDGGVEYIWKNLNKSK